MTGKKNMAASVRQRLLNRSKANHEDFNLVLLRYGMERLLYRIGASSYADDFVLKGAALFFLWEPNLRHRPTKDIDLLSSGSPDLDRLKDVFAELCTTPVPDDGLILDPKAITVSRIKEDMEYEGVRVKLKAALGKIPIALSVDVGFGDAVTPGPESASYPTLLEDSPAPSVQTYPRATVVAEKFQAMVDLGMVNTCLKDFFDVLFLSNNFPFDGQELVLAIQRTFERRRTPLPTRPPPALTLEFSSDAGKVKQWKAFLNKNKLDEDGLEPVVETLHAFLWPVVEAARDDVPWLLFWPPEGPWGPSPTSG